MKLSSTKCMKLSSKPLLAKSALPESTRVPLSNFTKVIATSPFLNSAVNGSPNCEAVQLVTALSL